MVRRPGEYIEGQLRALREGLARRRKRRLKQKQALRPIAHALRAAFGLPTKASPPPNPPPAQPVRVRQYDREADGLERKRVWIVVPSGIQYFRFVENKAFAEIEAACHVTYVFPHFDSRHRVPREAEQLHHEDVLFTPVDEQRLAVWALLFEVSCCALASRCASFRIRYEMGRRSRRERARTLLQQVFLRAIPVLASRPWFARFRRNIVRSLGPDPTLDQALAEDEPAAIILPSSLHDCLTNDVIVTARARRIPTIALQTSWDNLSSKGIVAVPPDVMGVWGEQSVNHAVDLQGMKRNRCAVVGSSYYEGFFRRPRRGKAEARRALGLPADGLTALFGGSFRQFDEAALLRQIEDAIDVGRLPKMLVFYRPHPGRELREEANFFDFHWKYTIMDEEVAVVYRANLEGRMISQNEFGYDLDRLADIYTAVDLTISPMSSIVLESLLFGLPVLGIGYSDGRNRWGPEKTSQMTHFDELSEVPCVRICQSPADMLDDFRTVLGWAARAESAATTREAARYFVDNGRLSYARSVLDLLKRTVPAVAGHTPDRVGTRPQPAAAAGEARAV
jgi:hypothetical protein